MATATRSSTVVPIAGGRLPGLPVDRTIAASGPLRIDGRESALLITSGRADVFALAVRHGVPAGRRRPLCQVAAGGLILGMPPGADYAVIAVPQRDTAIAELDWDQLATLAGEKSALIDAWIAEIAAAAFGDMPAWPEYAAEPGRTIELPAGKRLYVSRSVAWVKALDGRLMVGEMPVEAGAMIPIAAGLAAIAESDCAIEVLDTATALSEGQAGLDRFHAAVLSAVGGLVAQIEAEELRRIETRATAGHHSLRQGLVELAAVTGDLPAQQSTGVGRDPAVAALTAVAEAQGIELIRTPRFTGPAESAWRAFARVNDLGVRSVMLRGTWWRSDTTPLLAWRGEDEHRRPVALIPSGRRAFRMWDPAEKSSVTVDERVAAEVAPLAIMIYRPLPVTVSGIWGLMRFAAHGLSGELVTILVTGGLAGLLGLLYPLASGFLFGSVVPRAETGQIFAIIAGLALAAVGSVVFNLTKAIALLRMESLAETAMQPALMHRLMALPVNFFRGFGTGDLTNRVLSFQTMRRLLANNTLVALISALFATTSFVVILVYSPLLAAVSGALVATAASVSGLLAIGELRQERRRVALRGQEDGLVLQIIQAIGKIRVAASEARAFTVWAGLFSRQQRCFLIGQRYTLMGETFSEIFPLLGLLALFFFASRLLLPDITTAASGTPPVAAFGLGAFIAVNAAFGQLLAATTTLARSAATGLEIIPLFERLRPLLSAEPESRTDKAQAGRLSGRIDVSHVTFRYPGAIRPVLDDVSLSIEPGAFVAFVGPSGSGKSTLLRLLLGFETAESGDVLYDDQSIGTLDTTSLRSQIGVVLQNGRITTGSIFDNLTNGLPYKHEDAWEAARLAGIAEDIEAMPMGMHTLLIEGSSTLSGGQRQRLMIARALISRPRILMFDEATSALDNKSQALVTHSLEQLRTTRLVIAHRLTTVERADRIFVLDGGLLAESGNFAELMARDGLFSRLARRQLL